MAYISQIKLGPTTYDISAYKLKNARTINLTGAITGSASFDGTTNISINTTLTGSHTHDQYLPLTAGQDKKLTGPLGLTENINYGPDLPSTNTFDGQLFFLEDSGAILPPGGTEGQVLVKNSSMDNDANWVTDIAGNAATANALHSPNNGTLAYLDWTGQQTSCDWFATWDNTTYNGKPTIRTMTAANMRANLDIPTRTGGDASGTWGINITGKANYLNCLPRDPVYGANHLEYFNTHSSFCSGGTTATGDKASTPTNDWYHIIRMNHPNSAGYYVEIAACFHSNDIFWRRVASGTSSPWTRLWSQGNSVTGAVWNDYAEYRESDCEDFGYVLMETGDDSLTKTTERLSHFAGVSSDTWGFSQGETARARTPIAVAGRALVYPYQDRNNYKPGDCVCAAPGGTVDIMTREEVREWPDRIVGTVSCVPNYEEWGGGEGADRDPVKVNGRIWIKVK